ncbi:MAG: ABC transporter permease [Parcubacteria group bacterium]
MWRILLIAEREFRAYATTASFWLALAMGPLLMGVAALGLGALHREPAPRVVSIEADKPEAAAAVQGALEDAASVQGRPFKIGEGGTDLSISRGTVRIIGGEPLNTLEAELVRRDLYALGLAEKLRARGVRVPPLPRAPAPAPAPAPRPAPGQAFGRFAPVFLLWLTLVGALGMLLQSVVRERANRALEQLLAGARPPEIVFGKLLGVGVVSLLVLGSWLAAAAAMALTPLAASSGLLTAMGSPGAVLYAGAIYLMAFLMYGSALVCVGAAAADLPSAQNLSRPVFGLLLVIFFVSLASAMGVDTGAGWLVWAPPFTPFVLLLSPGALAPWQEAVAWLLMAATTAAVTATASRVLMISPKPLFSRTA